MASRVIPKEQLTAYQRWELLGLDESESGAGTEGNAAKPQSSQETIAVNLPTAEELERIHQQSAQEGFKLGHEEGYKAGYENGRKAGEADAKRLAQLVEALDTETLRQDEALSKELLGLALAVAKQMIRTALKVKEGLVLEVLREALNSMPGLTGHLRVFVHPDDLEAVNDLLASEHSHFSAKVIGDGRMERGGFRIESNYSEVDGELPIRWQEIIDCLGADDSWLD
jgi:flagellar assembly protein FliH